MNLLKNWEIKKTFDTLKKCIKSLVPKSGMCHQVIITEIVDSTSKLLPFDIYLHTNYMPYTKICQFLGGSFTKS